MAMSRPLICRSLRGRPDWASLTPTLVQGNGIKWKEAQLDTHDVAIPLPNPGGQSQRALRAILLSPSDVGKDVCRHRIQRLSRLSGGQDVAIVFLLKQEQGQMSAMAAFMTLQLEGSLIGEFEIPVIPVNSVQAVLPNLMAFHRQISTSSGPRKTADPARSLLPYCSDKPPLPEHVVHVLSDITSSTRDLQDTMSTPAGQMKMAEFLGNNAQNAISFWADEYVAE
ncbi:hypothetical protein F4821DRAFT_4305 [Hypoxylon rubiginosum]|uniref:Uncharacterized protein n=1 Tax=Hypoxylon rubiginosum TaxID=110542 RepID=A0ACC0DMI9_9PEZI|nr:hypothetical protein F4821DRAFT_4305 [Hypoxylon rubiginosum]